MVHDHQTLIPVAHQQVHTEVLVWNGLTTVALSSKEFSL